MFYLNSRQVLLIINRKLIAHHFRRNMSSFDKMPAFKSDQSLDKLYPKSNTTSSTDTTPAKPSTAQQFTGHIPIDKLEISYCRSSGPGGQHVNTTNTKVTVQLHLQSADWIPHETKLRLQELHKNSINKEGFWMIRSDKTRIQMMNVADCMDKIRCYITEASKPLYTPSIETLEKIRLNRERAAIRRLEQKRIRSVTKSSRRSVD
ncbi:unnamed protein product [Oppiella nova]|uniref:Large ribosomal subunit protein mL62 n=2 Tax=Oppiella nova TaxID=334625 RepID=A0A7R9MD83_9ACAR|nr:unnamed protein product [Oppiella nova]CAG2175081.1 unnamed protein product [Oppiella nova]